MVKVTCIERSDALQHLRARGGRPTAPVDLRSRQGHNSMARPHSSWTNAHLSVGCPFTPAHRHKGGTLLRYSRGREHSLMGTVQNDLPVHLLYGRGDRVAVSTAS